jgi:hypothetical protein
MAAGRNSKSRATIFEEFPSPRLGDCASEFLSGVRGGLVRRPAQDACGNASTCSFTVTIRNTSPGCFLGINLAGGPVTIDGKAWLSHADALTNGRSAQNAPTFTTTYGFPLVPAADADTRTMLQSLHYRFASPDQGYSLTQTLPDGTYNVYLWLVENFQSNWRNVNVRMEGVQVATRSVICRWANGKSTAPTT